MMGQLIKMEVLDKLQKEFGNNTFRNDNLVLSATHTHSGPAGYMQYIMYSISSFGFVEDSFQVINHLEVIAKTIAVSVIIYESFKWLIRYLIITGNCEWNCFVN